MIGETSYKDEVGLVGALKKKLGRITLGLEVAEVYAEVEVLSKWKSIAGDCISNCGSMVVGEGAVAHFEEGCVGLSHRFQVVDELLQLFVCVTEE